MQPMQFMQEGEGRHRSAQAVIEELKQSNFFEGSQEQSQTTDRTIADTGGPPTSMSGSLEEITK